PPPPLTVRPPRRRPVDRAPVPLPGRPGTGRPAGGTDAPPRRGGRAGRVSRVPRPGCRWSLAQWRRRRRRTRREKAAMHSWARGPFLGFDTETTGVDPRHDRIVTAALVLRDGRGTRQRTWLVDPGVEIPAAAAEIHGVTTDHARAEGMHPRTALEEIATELAWAIDAGIPVVVYNACFDITLLEHELVRWGLPTLADRLGREPGPVLDPLVLDRALDRYRSGKRKLVDLCRHYRVEA